MSLASASLPAVEFDGAICLDNVFGCIVIQSCPSQPESPRDWVDINFTKKLEKGGTIEASSFDEQSIMMYTILRTWNKEGKHVGGSSVFSDMDREMVRKWYPPRTIRRSPMSSLSCSSTKMGTQFSIISRRRFPLR
ncbi:hypothetical protein GGR55DRAFT_684315 [Xylaria sp. FL0064]|nr:hypothetical protein GGR55DRAFT_684315 [Xylaria sp. FL0064]